MTTPLSYLRTAFAAGLVISVLPIIAVALSPGVAGATPPTSMAIQINTRAPGCNDPTVILPLDGSDNANVDWGDGTTLTGAGGDQPHTYSPGTYTIAISGEVTWFGSSLVTSNCAITGVSQWGDIGITSLSYAFYGDTNLTSLPTTLPSGVTDLSHTLDGATSFNQNVSSWDTASVTNMSAMFQFASAFNNGGAALETTAGGWDTASVSNMSAMFQFASAFNNNVSTWNTTNVTDMSYMFFDATDFNQSVTGWNTSSVTTVAAMFDGASAFNQNVSAWDTSSITNMGYMFEFASAFNNGGAALETTVGGWNTSSVTTMASMFYAASTFNQNVSSWDTASVTNMSYMFYEDSLFNQSLSSWNTFNVTDMIAMFYEDSFFNQGLGSWSISDVTTMAYMLSHTGLSQTNYDSTLEGWAAETVKTQVALGAADLYYTAAAASARATLMNTVADDWTITDAGEAPAQSVTISNNSGTDADSAVFGSGPYQLNATASESGTLTYSTADSSVCSVDATSGAVTLIGVGSCTIRVGANATGNYAAATPITFALTITGAAQSVAVSNNSGTDADSAVFGSGPYQLRATASESGTLTYSTSSSSCSVDANSGAVTLIGVGSCTIRVGANATGNYAAATPITFALTITTAFVAPPTGPTNAPPPTNPSVPASSFGTPTSVTASCAATTTVSETSGGANETITVPQCALPSGTTVSAYPVINTAPLVAQVPAGSSYVLSFAVTWEAPNGTSPTATAPITMTITDLSIVAGDTIYELTSTGLVAVGTATANVTVTITFSSDPTFLVSHTTPVAQAPLRITTLSGTVGTALTLVTSGGSGSGAVSFTVTNATATGCRITGRSLTATGAGKCLVTAKKAADTTYLAASSSATTVRFTAKVIPVHLHATRVHHYARVGRTVTMTIVGTGFYGKPTITSNEAGTRAVVTHDSGKLLTVRVTVRAGSPKGKHTFTIRLANGKSCRIYYLVK